MKKRLFLGLAVLGAASMLCGFDSAETAESVLDKMQEASSSVESMAMDMDMNVDLSINIGDGTTTSTLAVLATGGFDIDYTMNPLAMAMDGSMEVSALGSGQSIVMKMYGVTNDAGEFETYVYSEDSATGEGEWVYENAGAIDMEELMTASEGISAADFAEFGLTFTLAPEAADVDGTECYQLSTAITTDTLTTILDKVATLTGEDIMADESVSQAMALLTGLQIDLVYYVDTATYQPVKMHIDMNSSDMTVLNQLLQASMGEALDNGTTSTVEIVLNDVSIDAVTDYNGVVDPITVPDEAIAAVESGEAASVEDLAAAM